MFNTIGTNSMKIRDCAYFGNGFYSLMCLLNAIGGTLNILLITGKDTITGQHLPG